MLIFLLLLQLYTFVYCQDQQAPLCPNDLLNLVYTNLKLINRYT